MITIPIVLSHNGISVFPDDVDCNLFYCIKTTPSIRKNGDHPVFNGLFWTDKANGTGESTSGIAGGWINFDANLGLSTEEEEEIKELIKNSDIRKKRHDEILAKEEERLALRKKASGDQDIAQSSANVPEIGEISLGSINFTSGTATLLEEESGNIVAWSSAGGPVSKFGDNNAAFALRLTADGAAIWYKALKTNSKAISIRYDLKFQIRVPSLEIRAYAGSTQSSTIEREVERVWKNVDKGCSDADVERIDVKSITQQVMDCGLINIEIKKGSADISSEYIDKIRESVMNVLQDKIKEIIASRITGLTPEERESSMIKTCTEELSSFVEMRFTQEDIMEWNVSPQGMVTDFLADISDEQRSKLLTLVDLSESEVDTSRIDVTASAPWDEAPYVTKVAVDLEYISNQKKESYILTKESPDATWMFRTPKNDNGKVIYRTSVYMKNHGEPYILPEKTTTGNVIVNVGKLGLVNFTFKPHPALSSLSGRNKVNTIQIDLWYDTKNGERLFSDTVILTPENTDGVNYSRDLGQILDQAIKYKVTYMFKSAEPVEIDEQHYYITDDGTAIIYPPYPFKDCLDINVSLPFVPGKDVTKVKVDFKYDDETNEFESSDSVEMSSEDEWESVTAKLVVVDKNVDNFRYRYRLYTSDDILKSDWLDGKGESEQLVLPIQKVMLGVNMLGIGKDYYSGYIHITSEDGIVDREIMLTEENSSKMIEWYTQSGENKAREYNYILTLFDNNGESLELQGSWKGAMYIIPKPKNETTQTEE